MPLHLKGAHTHIPPPKIPKQSFITISQPEPKQYPLMTRKYQGELPRRQSCLQPLSPPWVDSSVQNCCCVTWHAKGRSRTRSQGSNINGTAAHRCRGIEAAGVEEDSFDDSSPSLSY